MRVLEVMASGARGGGAEHLLGLLPELRARGHEVEAWVGDDGPLPDELDGLGIAVRPIAWMHSRRDPKVVLGLLGALRELRPDVVHWHGTRAAFYGAAYRGATVYTAHGLAYRKERRAVRRGIFLAAEAIACRADRVVSVSRTDRDELVARGFVRNEAAYYVPNAVRAERFDSRPTQSAARRALGLDDGAFVVGTTSRLVEQKGLDVALRAISTLPGAVFVVAGDGPLLARLRTEAHALGVDARWLGRRDDVGTVLSALDVFVLSSRWEGEPIAMLEALHCGLPCVATATAGARELLGDGAGWLVPIDDAAALSRALSEAKRVGPRPAAQSVVRERSFARMAAEIEAVLVDACRAKGGLR